MSAGHEARSGSYGWLIAVGCAAFVLFAAALAFQPELDGGRARGADALSRSPVGYAGVIQLLRADGADVRLSRTPDARARLPGDALVVLTPAPGAPIGDIAAVAKHRRVLLVPPKWVAAPDPRAPRRLVRAGELPPQLAHAAVQAVVDQQAGDGGVAMRPETDARFPTLAEPAGEHDLGFDPVRLRPIPHLRTLEGGGIQAVLVDGDRRVVLAIAQGSVDYVLADPDVINNQGVRDLAGARAAVRMLEGLADGGPIVFDLTLAGAAAPPSLLRLFFEPPLAPATVCALLLAVLIGLSARTRFGAVRRRPRVYALGKRALADSAASLLALAHREPRLAGRYAQVVRTSAADAIGLAHASTAQDAVLDRIGRERGAASWTEIVAQSAVVRTRADLISWARRAADWRREMTRG